MKRIANWALPLLLIGALTTPALAQAQQAQPAQAEPKWKDNKEYTDYMLVYDEKDPAKKAANAEKFFVDHKEADPIALTHVFKMMYLGYANAGNWVKVLETYDRMRTSTIGRSQKWGQPLHECSIPRFWHAPLY